MEDRPGLQCSKHVQPSYFWCYGRHCWHRNTSCVFWIAGTVCQPPCLCPGVRNTSRIAALATTCTGQLIWCTRAWSHTVRQNSLARLCTRIDMLHAVFQLLMPGSTWHTHTRRALSMKTHTSPRMVENLLPLAWIQFLATAEYTVLDNVRVVLLSKWLFGGKITVYICYAQHRKCLIQ